MSMAVQVEWNHNNLQRWFSFIFVFLLDEAKLNDYFIQIKLMFLRIDDWQFIIQDFNE